MLAKAHNTKHLISKQKLVDFYVIKYVKQLQIFVETFSFYATYTIQGHYSDWGGK